MVYQIPIFNRKHYLRDTRGDNQFCNAFIPFEKHTNNRYKPLELQNLPDRNSGHSRFEYH